MFLREYVTLPGHFDSLHLIKVYIVQYNIEYNVQHSVKYSVLYSVQCNVCV